MTVITTSQDQAQLQQIAHLARPLRSEADLDPLIERIGSARFGPSPRCMRWLARREVAPESNGMVLPMVDEVVVER
jgi:hypothetical protein